ncbi:MAG: hypothetical protein ACI82I_001398 [Gammaproteobacteria bacterium]|jgi:hypothetical protein
MAGWSSEHARLETAQYWRIRAQTTRYNASITRSNFAKAGGPLRQWCSKIMQQLYLMGQQTAPTCGWWRRQNRNSVAMSRLQRRARGLSKPAVLMRAVSSDFAAVTHVDFSARLQTVDPASHLSRAGAILQAFHKLTVCPMLLNTSFNVRGEPIVCTPRDAIDCFLNTHMDVLAIGPFLVHRSDQPSGIDQQIGEKKFDKD